MPYGQNDDLLPIEVIQSDIRALPKLHHPFTKLRQHVFHGSADLGMPAQLLNAAPDRLHRALSGISAFNRQKSVQTSYIRQRRGRPD